MIKAEPVPDLTRNTHNYFAQGGNELVIGGKLTFLPGATIEGGDDLFTTEILSQFPTKAAKEPASPQTETEAEPET